MTSMNGIKPCSKQKFNTQWLVEHINTQPSHDYAKNMRFIKSCDSHEPHLFLRAVLIRLRI